MSGSIVDDAGWEDANGRFLTVSLEWLRLLLRRQIDRRARPPAGPAPRSRPFGKRSTVDTGPARVSDEQLERAARAVAQAEAVTPPPALVDLAASLGLSRFERDTLLLCAAVEFDPAMPELYALAHGAEGRSYPTFGLALSVLPDPAWEVVSPQRGLRFWRLIEITQRGGQGLIDSAVRADERIVNYIKGLNYVDDRLTPLITRLDPAPGIEQALPPSQRAVADEIARHWRAGGGVPVVQLVGQDDAGKRLVAAHAAVVSGLIAYRLPASLLPAQPEELDHLARLWLRESTLLPLALYLDVEDTDAGEARPPVARFLSRMAGRAVFATRESWPDLGRQSLALDVEPPTPAERAAAWRAALGPGAEVDPLAAQYGLQLSAIREIAAVSGGDPDAAWRACRVRTRPRLDALAQRLEPKVGWDDIVLPEDGRRLLGQIADQVAQRTRVYETWGFGERITRGLGVSVLFAGPSGVGKTMAAEVLANQLRLDLYRIDLSAVVSKYIGETEKNLRRLFDAAEGGGSILFFDEADSLFGKRSEVKDAHDRYANIEINYLLQRMEAYRGLAILATNLRTALDNAFLRRLRFIVEFRFPGAAQRKTIWAKAFPPAAPRAALDYDRLAQLQVSGGMTRNIALNAAFLAASAGSPITMRHVLDAARTEFQKLELPIRDRDFAWTEEAR
ncbi:MAG TPA: ATP-binding protein [Actinophytocola sp.]|uniref:ATP-binding protein n=1 Tax=Actinophytocola sp. TaxID=1872138 RepID=UPI002DDD5E6B|nr:ATP-binding protein [Actinophytocola sp.]HEV2777782.1 ATP-binding protein [Actinophytocola sp.]